MITKTRYRDKAAEASRRYSGEAKRLAVIEALPTQMQEYALVDWPTVAAMLSYDDLEQARKVLKEAGVPLVDVSSRKRLPTFGALRRISQKPRGSRMTLPYASATSDMRAREEVKKILTRFGCESIGFMDDMAKHEVFLAFKHRRTSANVGVRQGLGADVAQRESI